MRELFEHHITTNYHGEIERNHAFWQTITDDFAGTAFSGRDHLTQTIEALDQFASSNTDTISQPWKDELKLSVKEIFPAYSAISLSESKVWGEGLIGKL
jgi:hypothetical protein